MFGVHGVGGYVGTLALAIFAHPAFGGAQLGLPMGKQLAVQAFAAGVVTVYTAIATWGVLKVGGWVFFGGGSCLMWRSADAAHCHACRMLQRPTSSMPFRRVAAHPTPNQPARPPPPQVCEAVCGGLRVTEEEEVMGLDRASHDEECYGEARGRTGAACSPLGAGVTGLDRASHDGARRPADAGAVWALCCSRHQ